MVKAAKRDHYDQQAREDRMAVAAAVRGTSVASPPEKPVRYGEMTDAQFAAEPRNYGV
jgi:hypothetical protein